MDLGHRLPLLFAGFQIRAECVSYGDILFDRRIRLRNPPRVSARREDLVFILFMSGNLGAEHLENAFHRGPRGFA